MRKIFNSLTRVMFFMVFSCRYDREMKTWLENGGAEAVKAAKKEAKKASKGSSGASKKSKEGKYQHFNNIAYDSIAST